MSKSIDEISRDKIIEDIDKSLFVEASAGSGKTTMLVRRMVAMIESCDDIDVSNISAITFTKAAATEFYERFQKLLSERSKFPGKAKKYPGDLEAPTKETAKRCEKALEKINLCFLGTIDSFCNMILSEHPNEAIIPSSSSIKSEEEMKNIYLREYNRIINNEYGLNAYTKYQEFIRWFDRPQVIFLETIGHLMNSRSYDLKYDEPDPTFLINFENKRIEAIKALKYLIDNLDEVSLKDTKKSQEAWENLKKYKNLLAGKWEGNYEKVFNILILFNKN